ncbi:general substrate transporter [Umbelopsis sp. PMI_123]|nr:general substrate transporter [Umbelopsis sp. PMI_123]
MENKPEPHRAGALVYGVVAFASIGGFLFGYDQGVMSGIIVMPYWTKYFNNPDDVMTGFIVSIYLLGAFAGGLFAGPISERIGRKRSIQLASVVFTLGSAIQAGASTTQMLLGGRFVQGLGIGMYSMNVPVYQSELSPPHLRGRFVALQQLSIVTGIMIAFWLGYGCSFIQSDVSWRLPLALQIVPSILLFFGMFFLPYSPRWLVDKNRNDEALQTLARLHADGDTQDAYVLQEYNEIVEYVKFERENAVRTYRDLFTKQNRKRVLLAVGIQSMQQWTGINAVLYYAPLIFKGAGLSGTASQLLATGLNGVVSVIATIPAVMYIDKWGRVKTLLVGGTGMGVTMLLAGALLGAYPHSDVGPNNLGAQYFAIVMMYFFTICFSSSWGPCGWIYPAEIFPNRARAKGTGLSTAANYLMNFVIGEITPIMLSRITYWTYIFFCLTNFACVIILYFFYPETRGLSLEQMEVLFGGAGADVVRQIENGQFGIHTEKKDEVDAEVKPEVEIVESAN